MSEFVRIITIFSVKGGVGCSFIACNLAVGIAQHTEDPVLLIDLDMTRGGSQVGFLGLEKEAYEEEKNLKKLLIEGINIKNIQSTIIKHKTNVHLLAAPLAKDRINITRAQIASLLGSAAEEYKNIVIDAAQPFINETLITCFDFSSIIMPVITVDLTSIEHNREFLEQMTDFHFSLKKFAIVLNMANLSKDIVEELTESKILDCDIEFMLPFDAINTLNSINSATPILQSNKSPELTKYLTRLVRGVLKVRPTDITEVMETASVREDIPLLESKDKVQPPTNVGTITDLIVVPESTKGMVLEKYRDIKKQIHARLVGEIKLSENDLIALNDPEKKREIRHKIESKIAHIIKEEKIDCHSRAEYTELIKEITDESIGLGPLEDLLSDQDITEIMVNGTDQIYVEKKGKLLLTNRKFMDERQLRVVIDRIVAPIGRRIDESSPMVDARLPDGSRVNVVIPPLSLIGPVISIRKFPKDRLQMKDYIEFGTLNHDMAEFLEGAVKAKLNIFISGGTGSGKTTLLNILSGFIPPDERIITIEDSAELQLHQEHVVRLESRPPNIEGKGEISIRDLVRNSLRMRPNRIVVGEVRGGEALDMLQAMNTGHEGSLTTGHANSPRDALSRLETMVLMAGIDLPVKAIREQISSAINLIVHQARLKDGTRKITNIVEIIGMEGDVIILQDIFSFEQKTIDEFGRVVGSFKHSEIRPKVIDNFIHYGIRIPKVFNPEFILKKSRY